MPISILTTLALISALPPAPVQDKALDERATRSLVARYREFDSWALKCVVLSAFGGNWHPAGSEAVLDALKGKDRRVRAFALEALFRTDPDALRAAATAEIVENLVRTQLEVNEAFYRERVLQVLARIAPDVSGKKADDWKRWWQKAKGEYAPSEWKAQVPEKAEPDRTLAEDFVERASELGAKGFDMVLCLETTAEMKSPIAAAKEGIPDVVALLQGLAPKFRVGLVEYRDEEMKDGAGILLPLTDRVEMAQPKMGAILPFGGKGEARVEKGLALALSSAMGWKGEAARLVIVIGGSPPHDDAVNAAIELSKDAHENPAGKGQPFVVSAMGVGTFAVNNKAELALSGIARLGGGTYGKVLTYTSKKEKAEDRSPADRMAGEILKLSFGEKWEKPLAAFAQAYRVYRAGGFIK